MIPKPTFLLAHARSIDFQDIQNFYDEQEQLTVVSRSGETYPLVTEDMFGWTESKTMRAPGDDDPDPEDEGCY